MHLPAHCRAPRLRGIKILGRSKGSTARALMKALMEASIGNACVSKTSISLFSSEERFMHGMLRWRNHLANVLLLLLSKCVLPHYKRVIISSYWWLTAIKFSLKLALVYVVTHLSAFCAVSFSQAAYTVNGVFLLPTAFYIFMTKWRSKTLAWQALTAPSFIISLSLMHNGYFM